MTPFVQRRLRSQYGVEVTVHGNDKTIKSAHTRNISLNGVLIESTEFLPMGTPCTVEIALDGVVPPIVLKIIGIVSRLSGEGFAVNFQEMDIDTYEHLQNIVLHNSENPDAVIDQNAEKPGFK